MNVEELIEALKKMPPKAKVEMCVPCGWENYTSEVCDVKLREDGVVEL